MCVCEYVCVCVCVCYTYVACTDTVIQSVAQVAHTQKAFSFTHSHSHSRILPFPFPVAWLFPFQVLLGEAFRRVGPLRFTAISWACVCACVWTTSIKQAADNNKNNNNKFKQSCHFLCHFLYAAAAAQPGQQLHKLENARERDYVSVCVFVCGCGCGFECAWQQCSLCVQQEQRAWSHPKEALHKADIETETDSIAWRFRLYHNLSLTSRRASDRARVREKEMERVSDFNRTACKFSLQSQRTANCAQCDKSTHMHFT